MWRFAMAVGLYYSESCLLHDTGDHPESVRRLEAVMRRLRAMPEWPSLSVLEAPAADLEWLLSVHSPKHVRRVEQLAAAGGGWLDPDTVVSPGSWEAALHAAGGTVAAGLAVARGDLSGAFVAVRPPGHHAPADRGMGFCLFNNVAIAARRLLDLRLASRVAVVDFDVHHGNGTQDIFYDDPSVLYFSTHQMPLYPGSGSVREVGVGAGEGFTMNVPLDPGVGDEGYGVVFDWVLAPALRRYRPEVILVSAGYDPHWRDPLASMRVTVPGFRAMASRIQGLAGELCAGKVVYVLEGGYDTSALASAVEATLLALLGSDRTVPDPHGEPARARGREAVEPVVAEARRIHGL